MIDVETRSLAANALSRFLSCVTTNDEYENEYPLPVLFGRKQSSDKAIIAVYEMSWNWFDDFSSHKLEGRFALEPEIQNIADRCLWFLNSHCEYEWEVAKFIGTGSWGRSLLIALNLSQNKPSVSEQIKMHLDQPEGDAIVWPFFRQSDLPTVHLPNGAYQAAAQTESV